MSSTGPKRKLHNPELYQQFVNSELNKLARLHEPAHVQHLKLASHAIEDFLSRRKQRSRGGNDDDRDDQNPEPQADEENE